MKKKGLYLIPLGSNIKVENGKPVIGSSTHIGIGIEQLGRHFEMHSLVLNEVPVQQKQGNGSSAISVRGKTGLKTNQFIGVFRDLKAILVHNRTFYHNYKRIKEIRPDFIYERSEYLNLQGLLIAGKLGIPHFYEGNWIHYSGIQQFYDSWFNPLAKRVEEWMYAKTTHSFLVGNQHLLLNLDEEKYSTIQNGVSSEVVERFASHKNQFKDGEIKVCIMASLMKHHRLDIFLDSLQYLKHKERIKVYFIGKHFEPYLEQIPEGLKFEYPGALPKDKLYDYLSQMNIAVISGGPFYSSFMKLFDFAAVKLAVVCPDLSNLTNNFTGEEIKFFPNENPHALAEALDSLIESPDMTVQYGENLYQKVRNNFTWELIYDRISEKISQYL